jgi:ABC-type nitrate/sulfonate/bicarbonate transport system permease component
MQPGMVIVYMILIGVVGGLMDALLRKLEKRVIKWRQQ